MGNMSHKTSGRIGFENIPLSTDQAEIIREAIPYETAKAMLTRENELRLSDHYQVMYKNHSIFGLDGCCAVTEMIQCQVIDEFTDKLAPLSTALAAHVLRSAELLYPEQKQDIRQLSLYRKYNRMVDGNLNVGDVAPCVTVFDVTGNLVEIPVPKKAKDLENEAPLVLIAGSIS